jgi:hypothetical protein
VAARALGRRPDAAQARGSTRDREWHLGCSCWFSHPQGAERSQKDALMNRLTLATCLSTLTAAAIALTPGDAGATKYSGQGWLQLDRSSSKSVSTTIKGNDFGIGYTASFGLDGYNWDVAPDTISETCVMYMVTGTLPPFNFPYTYLVVESMCATLPGTKLSTTNTSTNTTYNGDPAIKLTTTVVWDVQNSGAMAQVDGYFRVPVTLFDEDFDLFKLTATAVGKTYDADKVSSDIYVLGAKLASSSASLPASKRIVQKCQTLAEAEAEYEVVGIPIVVSASADGCIYVDASASWGSRTLTGTVTPGASVDATAKAGIGGDIGIASASAGVYGTITVIDASVPVSLSAAVAASGVTVNESAKLTMTGLDGEVGLYAEACIFGICDEDTLTLFDWTGMTYANATLFSESQTVSY